jgi:hypothetical protein
MHRGTVLAKHTASTTFADEIYDGLNQEKPFNPQKCRGTETAKTYHIAQLQQTKCKTGPDKRQRYTQQIAG